MFSMKAAALLLVASALVQVALCAKINPKNIAKQMEGTPAPSLKAFPFQVGIAINGSYQASCLGVLVEKNAVLTSATCATKGQVTVILGALNHTIFSPPAIRIDADTVVVHPNFNPQTNANDLALVKVPMLDKLTLEIPDGKSKIKVAEKIKGSLAADKSFAKTCPNNKVNVTGLGEGVGLMGLVFAEFDVLNQTNCSALANESGTAFNASSQGCIAVNGTANTGPCTQDSGAPLTCWGKTGTTLIGILAPNENVTCQDGLNFRIFTRITVFGKSFVDKQKTFPKPKG